MKSPLTQLVVAFVLCAAVLGGYGAWYAAIANKSNAVAAIENQITEKTEAKSRIAFARAALADIEGDESAVQSHFVSETGVVGFINYLEARGTAQKADVNVLSVSTGGDKARSTLVLALAVRGAFDAVMRTVGAIEYAPYDLSIKTFSIAHEDKGAWHADLTLVVGSMPALLPASSSATQKP
jgi:hypothetical protein